MPVYVVKVEEDHGCCGCCCCCLCIFLIIYAIISFFIWLIVRPKDVNFTVTDASLAQFKFTNNNTLNYDLAVNITIRNPNGRLGIYYDNIETLAFYKHVRFGSQTLGKFFQHRKSTSFVNPNLKGQQVVPLNSDQISEFDKEKKDGDFDIDVKVLLNVRFKLGLFKIRNGKPMVHCNLQVPLKSSNGNEFQATHCDWVYKWYLFH